MLLLNILSGLSFACLYLVLGLSWDHASYVILSVVVGVTYYVDFRKWLARRIQYERPRSNSGGPVKVVEAHRRVVGMSDKSERNVALVLGALLILFMVWRFYG